MDWVTAATIAGAIVGLGSLIYTARGAVSNARTNRAHFWRNLRMDFSEHAEVHKALRPGGKWAVGGGPQTNDDWARVDAYMGLFEHCEIMLELSCCRFHGHLV